MSNIMISYQVWWGSEGVCVRGQVCVMCQWCPYLASYASHTSAHWTDFLAAANITNISNTPLTLNREVKYF